MVSVGLHGREIENYLTEHVVVATCEELVGKTIKFSIGKYDKFEEVLNHALKTARARKIDYSADKVKYAREFINHFRVDDMEGQLRKHLEEIVAKIKSWNN